MIYEPRLWCPERILEDGTTHKIGELCADPEDDVKEPFEFKITRGLLWHVVFAPDESCFAWISSPRKVVLIPWDRQRNRLETEDFANNQLKDLPCGSGSFSDGSKRKQITIECGYAVLSIAFGSGTPEKTLVSDLKSRGYWTRFGFTKDIFLATGHTNGRIRIWNAETGKLLLELMDHSFGVRDLCFAPDGSLRLVSASLDGTLKGWDLNEDGNMFKTFYGHKGSVLWCSWSPSTKLMASGGSEKTVYIWEMNSYKLFRKLDGHFNNVVSCSFSPDGAVLATASWDTQVILWDPYTGATLRRLFHVHPLPNLIYASGANNAWVRGVSFAKDGMNLVTIADDHLIRFWNLMGDIDPEGIAGEEEETLCCTYSPSGRCVAVGTTKFKVNFYSTPSDVPRLMHLARMSVRKIAHSPTVDKLEIPNSLKSYLKYEVWN